MYVGSIFVASEITTSVINWVKHRLYVSMIGGTVILITDTHAFIEA